jgi:hypothetical protein
MLQISSNEGYKTIGLHAKKYMFWGNYEVPKIQNIVCPNFESSFWGSLENDHFNATPTNTTNKYYVEEGGAFSQIWAVIVNPLWI